MQSATHYCAQKITHSISGCDSCWLTDTCECVCRKWPKTTPYSNTGAPMSKMFKHFMHLHSFSSLFVFSVVFENAFQLKLFQNFLDFQNLILTSSPSLYLFFYLFLLPGGWHLAQDLGGPQVFGGQAPGPAAAVAQLLPDEVHGALRRQDVPDAVAAQQQKLVVDMATHRAHLRHRRDLRIFQQWNLISRLNLSWIKLLVFNLLFQLFIFEKLKPWLAEPQFDSPGAASRPCTPNPPGHGRDSDRHSPGARCHVGPSHLAADMCHCHSTCHDMSLHFFVT